MMSRTPVPHSAYASPSALIFRRSTISAYSLAVAVALALVGYTVLLMVVVNVTGTTEASRQVTVPLRLVIVSLFGLSPALAMHSSRHPAVIFFAAFSLIYFGRIGVEWASNDGDLYRPAREFLLYFLSFVFLPFLLVTWTRVNERVLNLTIWAIFFISVPFVVLTGYYYGDYVGQTDRLSFVVTREEEYISPLALSYTSSLIIGLIVSFWVYHRGSRTQKVILGALFLAVLVPFFLGASRGSVVALVVVGLFFLCFQRNLKYRFWFIAISVFAVFVVVYAEEHVSTGVFSRLANLPRDIETGASSVIRLVMWRDGVEQFMSAPVFGNSLQLENFRFHPHNIFIEVLISTGMVGFLTFVGFVGAIVRSAVRIVRNAPQHSWVVVVFLVGFTSHQFSGSVATAVTMAIGAGLIVSTAVQIRRESQRLL